MSVDYRLAPEHPFPAAVWDAYKVTEWVSGREEFTSVAVGGDSAGGTLAAVTSMFARDVERSRDGGSDGLGGLASMGSLPDIDYQALVYPATNYLEWMASYRENREGYFLSLEDMRWFLDQYLGDALDGRNPYAFPLNAADFSGLPSAAVVTAGFDPLRDEGGLYAERLREAGVEVRDRRYGDVIHGFFSMTFSGVGRAWEAVDDVAGDLRRG